MKQITFLIFAIALLGCSAGKESSTSLVSSVRLERTDVNFILQNKSARSIPLIIPGVMNPNLSPFSNSSVTLAYGQEILFKENGKRYVLLTVDNTIEPGTKVDVAGILKARKKELGL